MINQRRIEHHVNGARYPIGYRSLTPRMIIGYTPTDLGTRHSKKRNTRYMMFIIQLDLFKVIFVLIEKKITYVLLLECIDKPRATLVQTHQVIIPLEYPLKPRYLLIPRTARNQKQIPHFLQRFIESYCNRSNPST